MAGSDTRIEITIEAVNNATAALQGIVKDLKGITSQTASTSQAVSGLGDQMMRSFSSTNTAAKETVDNLKKLGTQAAATNTALSAKVSNPLKENTTAWTEHYKALAAKEAAYQEVNRLRIAGNERERASDNALAANLVAQKKVESAIIRQSAADYQKANQARIAGNQIANNTDKERSAIIANQVKAEAAALKQSAAIYQEVNRLRIAGNKVASTDYDKGTASRLAAQSKAVLGSDKDALKAQERYWVGYYEAQGVAATQAARETAKATRETAQAAKETGGAFNDLGGIVKTALSSYLVYQFLSTLKNATSAVLEWMGNMETYGIAIAASLQVGGKYVETTTGRVLEGTEAFKVAQKDAVGVIEALQVANFQTVATLDQLIRMYQEALPIAMKKGFDKKMVQDFTLSVTQAASAMGVSMDMMAEEARSLLTGAINMRNSRVAVALGITPEDVRQNSASASQLFDFLMGKLQVYRTAGEALQNSWRGLWSNFKDIMMQAGGKALEPLHEF